MSTPRIVSLIASATEIVCELGFAPYLVGRSHECDYPPSVEALPVCTRLKFNSDGRSYEIDQRVKALVQEALSVYLVDSTQLNELRPTHILTQSHCDVCAVSLKDVEKAVCELTQSNPIIVALEPNSLEDVWRGFEQVATALNQPERAQPVVSRLKRQMESIAQKTGLLQVRPTVACLEWIDPLMAIGNWMPDLVEMAGGRNLLGAPGKHSSTMSWHDVVKKNPEILVVMPCGFDISRTLAEMDLLTGKPEWKNLAAVKNQKVFVTDGNQFFNRPGPRLLESLQILAEIFHPDLFRFGHEGKGWVKCPG